MSDAAADTRPPRGALVVVAVGLFACVLAALLTTDKSSGSAAEVEWVQRQPIPDSKPAPVPGGSGQIRLTQGGIRASGLNVSGYELFRVVATLRIDAGAPVGGGRVLCTMRAPGGSEVGQTPGSRASYPRSSEEVFKQEVPENVVVEFSSHGSALALVEFGDAFERFANERGIKVEWPTYRVDREQWEWFLPSGPPAEPLELGFASIWRTSAVPAASIACTLTTSAGEATVRTAGELTKHSPPIAE